jgi:NodT family efflux transporter outer membrane factor (OMF) lipoprotein
MKTISLLLLLTLSACSVGPDWLAPVADYVPSSWVGAPAPAPDTSSPNGEPVLDPASDPRPDWWKSFNDPQLDSLMERAYRGNLDLQQAMLRIQEARDTEITAAAAGLPQLSAGGSYTRYQLGLKGAVKGFGGASGSSSGGGFNTGSILNLLESPFDLYQLSLNASWEIDLFGRVRRAVEAAEADTEATREMRNDLLVSLQAQVGEEYAQLRSAQAQNAILTDNVKIEKDILDLTKNQYQRGLTSALDVDQAATQLNNTEAQQTQYTQAEQTSINELNLLLGVAPGTLDQELTPVKPVLLLPPDVPLGLPATLARRRPDIRMAEAQLHEATAELGVAVADLYPNLTLSGETGLRSTDFNKLFNWDNNFYQIGPSLSVPIFSGGRLSATVDLDDAKAQEAALTYKKTVLGALTEVENALVAYRNDRARQLSLFAAVESAADGLKLSRERYTHGLSSFIDVLTTEASLVQAQTQAADATLKVTVDLVTLYRALGGGWQADPLPDEDHAADHVFKHLIEQ